MQLNDFNSPSSLTPLCYSDGFPLQNKKDILAFQKDYEVHYRPFFKTRRLFYLLRSHLSKTFHIGQASYAGVGDTVLYSHLPRLLKTQWPDHRVLVYETPISKVIFAHNPFVDGYTTDKKLLWKKKGSGCDFGSGHFTQMKARFFGLKECLPKGELFISAEESKAYRRLDKPVATLHAFGLTTKCSLSVDIWAAIVQELKKSHAVIQLKAPNEPAIPGIDQVIADLRHAIVAQSFAQVHVGVDSGYAHTAAALNIPAVIILEAINKDGPLAIDGVHQIMLPQVHGAKLNFLYPQHSFLCVGTGSTRAPVLCQQTLRMAINGEIYPFRNPQVWDWRV